MKELLDTLALRNQQVEATTEEEREGGGDDNPIIYAESGPNRFNVMSLFFTDSDGVKIEEDTETREILIQYFNDSETTQLTEGAVYDWALNFYKEENR